MNIFVLYQCMYIHGEEKIIFCTSEAIGNVCVIVRNIATAQGKLATYWDNW